MLNRKILKVFGLKASFLADPDILMNLGSLISVPSTSSGITAIASPFTVKPWPEKVTTLTLIRFDLRFESYSNILSI